MAIELTGINKEINYLDGTIDGHHFSAKHYDEGSKFGIDGGRTSKLTITKDQHVIAHYDRGWDMEPISSEHKETLNEVVNYLEKLPKRYEKEMELTI